MTEFDPSAEVLVADRRGTSRRVVSVRRAMTGGASLPDQEVGRLAPRRKVERRRQIDPTTCERDYTADEVEFMRAMDEYKRNSGRQFPTWSEVLEVLRGMGYKRD
jgi:hypothetical protein